MPLTASIKLFLWIAMGINIAAPIIVRPATISGGGISTTATFKRRYGIPQRKPRMPNWIQDLRVI
jgi:hypothetical protein